MMKRIGLISFISLLCFVAPTGVFAQNVGFTQNLSRGMTNTDIYLLQSILNINPATGYFGPITFKAVVAFQRAYGIPTTGTVGPITRAKLNSLLTGSASEVATGKAPSIASVTPLNLPAGNQMTVAGVSIGAPGNVIKIGGRVMTDILKSTAGSVTFRTPADLAPGQQLVTVTSAEGVVSKAIPVVILNSAIAVPSTGAHITKITPSVATYGTLMTIEGTGFNIGANTIEASYAVLDNIQSTDGTHLSFIVDPPIPRWGKDPSIPKVSWELWVRVNNKGEISNEVSYTFNPF